MKINYNNLAENYENTREVEPLVYSILCYMLKPSKGNLILDFGCGTGNYLKLLVSDYEIEPYGVEPSIEMRYIAQNKLNKCNIKRGNHTNIPFPKNFFNKIYCIDVIHHIRDINRLFFNSLRITSSKALFCICTETPQQLSEKYWLKYFPSASKIDCKRFHTIDSIINTGINAGWTHKETLTIENEIIAPTSHAFMKCVKQKTLSVLHLIPNEEYKRGFIDMNYDYKNQVIFHQHEGYTLILFEKENT